MKFFIFSILVLTTLLTDPIKIRKINSAKEEARQAFVAGNYKGAIEKYKYLIDSLDVNEDEVYLNLAHAYYQEKDTANATTTYQSLTGSTKKEIASKAHQQLGIIAHQQGKLEQALSDFKQAVKANPANEQARYDYEMLKKKLDDRKKQDQKDQQNKDQKDQKKDQQNKDQQKKDQENKDKQDQQKKDQEKKDQEKKDQEKKDQEKKDQEKKDQQNKDQKDEKKEEQEKKEQQEKQQQEQDKKDKEKQNKDLQNLDREKLQQMKISEEKARMILEAMKNQEKQYLQQQKRKPVKARDKSKPDW
jgi:Ca-activated chloride channel family protein